MKNPKVFAIAGLLLADDEKRNKLLKFLLADGKDSIQIFSAIKGINNDGTPSTDYLVLPRDYSPFYEWENEEYNKHLIDFINATSHHYYVYFTNVQDAINLLSAFNVANK